LYIVSFGAVEEEVARWHRCGGPLEGTKEDEDSSDQFLLHFPSILIQRLATLTSFPLY
jgi:hypothetical protein